MTNHVRRYDLKMYPNKGQLAQINRQAQLSAILWNAALEQRETQWRQQCQRFGSGSRKGLGYYDQCAEVKSVREAFPEYKNMSFDSASLVLKALDDAFKAFFRRAKSGAGKSSGYPKFKSVQNASTVWYRDAPKGWKIKKSEGKNHRIYAKGIDGHIKARGCFPKDVSMDEIEIRDMRMVFKDGTWWFSIAVKMPSRRTKGKKSVSITVDPLDDISYSVVSSRCKSPIDGYEGGMFSVDRCADIGGSGKTASDSRLSEIDSRYKRGSCRWRQHRDNHFKRVSRDARRNKLLAHTQTSRIVSQSGSINLTIPKIAENVESGRGDSRNHGAAVAPVAAINRRVLSMMPSEVSAMLEYKSKEAGVDFEIDRPKDNSLIFANKLKETTKKARQSRRKLANYRK